MFDLCIYCTIIEKKLIAYKISMVKIDNLTKIKSNKNSIEGKMLKKKKLAVPSALKDNNSLVSHLCMVEAINYLLKQFDIQSM